jgi:CheY-like chemotaxis protein
VHEAFDGAEAVRLMEMDRLKPADRHIDVILMDLWMPHMDGYEAARRILAMQRARCLPAHLRILAVTADVTDAALDRARAVGMHGIMTKPYNLVDLERLIVEYGPVTKIEA